MTARHLLLPLIPCLALAGGCKSLTGKSPSPEAPRATGEIPERSAQELVDYLNRQAALIENINYTDVSVHASENGKDMPRLGDSSLAAAKPRNFRLVCGTLATSNEVDLGSNDREFWMYVKRMEGPHNFFFCSHEDFHKGVGQRFPIPFDTDWVMQALGMANFADDGQYEVLVNRQHRKYLLTQSTVTPNGVPVRKVVAFNVDHDGGRRPVVAKHLIVDGQNQTLASADILRTKTVRVGTDPQTGRPSFVQVPGEVVLEWPTQKFRMRLVLDGESVNEDLSSRTALFERPRIRGANPIDLAQYTFEPTSRSQMPERRRR